MKFIETFREGDRIGDIYLCKYKQSAVAKNGKTYENQLCRHSERISDTSAARKRSEEDLFKTIKRVLADKDDEDASRYYSEEYRRKRYKKRRSLPCLKGSC